MKLHEIAKILGCNIDGRDFEVKGINGLKEAEQDEISFALGAKYAKEITQSKAGAIIVDDSTVEFVPAAAVALKVNAVQWEMAGLTKLFAPPIEEPSLPEAVVGEGSTIAKSAAIMNGATVGKNCTIMSGVYIGARSVIGDNTIIYPNVVIYRDCAVGSDCIIHANSVIGGDGFGFATNKMGEHRKIYQNGNTVIEDAVEIGSCTTIDRAVFGTTLIKKGVHIDNLVQVGHNCVIGEHSVIVSQAGLAGSTTMGRSVVMGGQSATAGHLSIAPFTMFAARSGITKSINDSGKTFGGFPLMEQRTWLKLQGKIAKLLN